MVARETAFLVLTVLSLTVAKVDSIGLLVRICCQWTAGNIWMAETRDDAYKAFDSTVNRFGDKYPGAMKCLGKDKAQMLAFYDFPAIHWQHIRTSTLPLAERI
jgi:hypothetical protein